MIITKTPLRLPLGGGGTDLPEYYSRFGSHLVTAAIDQHIWVFLQSWFEDGIKVGYTKSEIVRQVGEIQHPVVREALRLVGISSHLEILSMAELPSNTGLGSSAVYTVGLLHALYAYQGRRIEPGELAELGCRLQMEVLGEAGGKQDQYAAAFGGLLRLDIDRDGRVQARRLEVAPEVVEELENNLLYFNTGLRHDAKQMQSGHARALQERQSQPTEALHRIGEIGWAVEEALLEGELERFGLLLDEHWRSKRQVSGDITNPLVDACYQAARQAGALGGKLMGAGGGGFLMFYCPNEKKPAVRRAMRGQGLQEVRFRFELEGSTVLLNLKPARALAVAQPSSSAVMA